jgi:uncharacterized protein (TIGR02145 family)
MKYVSGLWVSPNTGATNSSGFSALPGGYSNSFGAFGNIGGSTNFWSSSEYSAINAIDRHLLYNTSDIRRYNFSKLLGFSARCTKD